MSNVENLSICFTFLMFVFDCTRNILTYKKAFENRFFFNCRIAFFLLLLEEIIRIFKLL